MSTDFIQTRPLIERDGSSFQPHSALERQTVTSSNTATSKLKLNESEAKVYIAVEAALNKEMDELTSKLA